MLVNFVFQLFSGHYDTTVGAKVEKDSYQAIAKDIGVNASEVLFLTDITQGKTIISSIQKVS